MKYAMVGSGAIGTSLARRFAATGIEVGISNFKGAESLAGLARELEPLVKPVARPDTRNPAAVALGRLMTSQSGAGRPGLIVSW